MKKNQKKLFILMVLYNATTLISLLLPISNEMKAITLVLCLKVDSLCSTFLKGGYELAYQLSGFLSASVGITALLIYAKKVSK